MKNKVLYVLFGILVSFSVMGNVYADDITLSTKVENNTIAKGGTASISVNIKSSVYLQNCEFTIESDSSILCDNQKTESLNHWTVLGDGNVVRLQNNHTTNEYLVNGENAATLYCAVNDAGNVVLKNIQCSSGDTSETYSLDTKTVSFTVTEPVNEDTTLGNLEVTKGGSLSSAFDPDSSSRMYMIMLDSANFGLELTASDSKFQDKIVVTDESGNVISDYSNITFNSPSGQETMTLVITINNDTVYTLMVVYSLDNLDNTVKSITINGEELELFEGQLTYEYVVDSDVDMVVVDAELNDSENFKFNTSTGYAPASNGPAKFSIKDVVHILIGVEPKISGGTSLQYYVKVIKKDALLDEDKSNDTTDKDKTETKPNNSTGTGNNGSNNNVNTNTNPGTGDVSMIVMAGILIVSLVGSLVIYRKNLEGYK